jgi:hypothetical protein
MTKLMNTLQRMCPPRWDLAVVMVNKEPNPVIFMVSVTGPNGILLQGRISNEFQDTTASAPADPSIGQQTNATSSPYPYQSPSGKPAYALLNSFTSVYCCPSCIATFRLACSASTPNA